MQPSIIFEGPLTNVRPAEPPEDYVEPEQEYWESDDIVDSTFEDIVAEVCAYLDEPCIMYEGVMPNISWAPLSETRWELVAFLPEYGSAVIDSTYATPEVARQVMAFCPEVGLMKFSDH